MRVSVVATIYLISIIAITLGQVTDTAEFGESTEKLKQCLSNYNIEHILDSSDVNGGVSFDNLTTYQIGCATSCFYKSLNLIKDDGSIDIKSLVGEDPFAGKFEQVVSECRSEAPTDDCKVYECIDVKLVNETLPLSLEANLPK